MRILLDESLPRKLSLELTGHETQTVQRRGWSGLKNGALLRTASQEFQVLLTGDQKLEFLQNPDPFHSVIRFYKPMRIPGGRPHHERGQLSLAPCALPSSLR
jgi:hypothetical protein